MLPKKALPRLLGAGLVATLVVLTPGAAQAVPRIAVAQAQAAVEASYDQKLAVAIKFGHGDDFALIELADRDFVIALWNIVKNNADHLEVRAAAELAFSDDVESSAAYDFIVTGVFAAFDRDVERERQEAEAKRASDAARSAAAASIDVVADAALLNGSDADFVRLIWERTSDDVKWPKVKAAARAARDGSDADRTAFITGGMAAAAGQDVDDRIAADEAKTEAEKAAERARAAKKLAANRIGMTVTDQLLSLPDRDFVIEVWNFATEGSEVQAAAMAASRNLDPAAWKTFIDTGVHQAKDRDIEIALERAYQADRAAALEIRKNATAAGDLNLAWYATQALAGTPAQLNDFVRAGQFDLDLTTGFETADVQPTLPATGGVANVTTPAVAVASGTAHTGTAALVYSGTDVNTQSSYAYLKSMPVSRISVKPSTTLSYWIRPQSTATRPEAKTRNSTCVSVDLLFSDGSTLRDSQLTDQNGVRVHPAFQCSKIVADRWNQVVVPLGRLADKQVTTVMVGYDQPKNAGGFRTLIDDLTITDQPVEVTDPGHDPVDYPLDDWRNDFNSDGNADVIGRNSAGELKLYRGNGKGNWVDPSTNLQVGTGFNSFNLLFPVADFSGDGNLDMAARNAAGELKLYRSNGKGGWLNGGSPETIGTGWNNWTSVFSPGDFNGDGFTDVITRNSGGELFLYRGNGKGGWIDGSTNIRIGTGWNQFNLIFSPGDFNGDGNADVIGRNAAGELKLYRGNGKGGWLNGGSPDLIGTGWQSWTAVFSPGDFNGDGFTDVITRNSGGELFLYRGNGRGGWVDGSTNIRIGTGWNQFNLLF
ncbi:VCBS repeat-containing protein [Actinoplanes bogorensis]|uniref:VCBS repeat-containing protein n=1 Tax=Paractinoplanes bogorensis TaxID=1610840 RepID=A0ABS5YU43_9ACTN|nr:VCBS repeat-containing protein [Actinoplanes bogorensis]MBU2666199.1 VCBS repeat-containing protein [Actinoplanes bogorensis]